MWPKGPMHSVLYRHRQLALLRQLLPAPAVVTSGCQRKRHSAAPARKPLKLTPWWRRDTLLFMQKVLFEFPYPSCRSAGTLDLLDFAKRRATPLLLAFGAWAYAPLPFVAAHAQGLDAVVAYPSKPVRIIVPFPPGGSNDIVGRFIANKLTTRLKRQFVIDNRGGADSVIGSALAANAAADGYTLLIASVTYPLYQPPAASCLTIRSNL